MSGFKKDDVISILRTNTMLHKDSVGLVLPTGNEGEDLVEELTKQGCLVVRGFTKPVITYSYIVMQGGWNPEVLLKAFSYLSESGILIIDASNGKIWEDRYVSLFGKFTATKVTYGDRAYIVIHAGVDYGN